MHVWTRFKNTQALDMSGKTKTHKHTQKDTQQSNLFCCFAARYCVTTLVGQISLQKPRTLSVKQRPFEDTKEQHRQGPIEDAANKLEATALHAKQ